MRVSVVIPVLNEENNISPLIKEIRTVLEGKYVYEIIYVDDHSSDRTMEILSQQSTLYPELRVIRLSRQCGQSAALLAGVNSAIYPFVITMDGDGQNDPADIARIIDYFLEYTPVAKNLLIVGHRQQRRDSGWKLFTSRIANRVRGILLHDGVPDSGCGIKAFNRDFFLRLPTFNHMHRFMPALFKQNGGEVVSLEVNHRNRSYGSSHYGTLDRLWAGIYDLIGVSWLGRRAILPEIEKEINNNG